MTRALAIIVFLAAAAAAVFVAFKSAEYADDRSLMALYAAANTFLVGVLTVMIVVLSKRVRELEVMMIKDAAQK